MRWRGLVIAVLLAALVLPGVPGDSGRRRQTLDAVILVSDRFDAADQLEQWVDTGGGYLVSRKEDALILRVPSEEVESFVSFLDDVADEVVQVRQETIDIGQELLEAEAGIKSKTELFDRALTLIDETDLETTLEIEREVLSILQDIEQLQGRYRMLLSEVELALVNVHFTLEEETIPQNLPSAFAWINAVDFYGMMQEYQRR